MKTMFEHYGHHGVLGNPQTLGAILGRKSRILRAYFEQLAVERTSGRRPGLRFVSGPVARAKIEWPLGTHRACFPRIRNDRFGSFASF